MASFTSIPTYGAASAFGLDAGKYAKLAGILGNDRLAAADVAAPYSTGAFGGSQTIDAEVRVCHQALVAQQSIVSHQAKLGQTAFANFQGLCAEQNNAAKEAIVALRSTGVIASSTGAIVAQAVETIQQLAEKQAFAARECYTTLQEMAAQKIRVAQQCLSTLAGCYSAAVCQQVLFTEEALICQTQEIGKQCYGYIYNLANQQHWIAQQALQALQHSNIVASPAGYAIRQALLVKSALANELAWGAQRIWSIHQTLTIEQLQVIKSALASICGGKFGGANTNANLYNVAFRPSTPVEFYSLTNPIRVLDREGNRQLWLCYELKGFKPEEVTVTLNKAERAVIVEAAHEVKEGKEHHILRKFYRKFVLPEAMAKVDLSKVELKSCLNADGFLTIECNLPKMTVEEIAKCPIMSKINEMPFSGYSGYYGAGFGGLNYNNTGLFSAVGNVKPVTVKTA